MWLNRDLVRGPYLALCLTKKDFKKHLKDLGVKRRVKFVSRGANATTHHLQNKERGIASIVCLGNWKGREGIEIAGLLVHEAVHVWQEYHRSIREEFPSSEFEAYSIQTLSQSLMQEFLRQRKEKGSAPKT